VAINLGKASETHTARIQTPTRLRLYIRRASISRIILKRPRGTRIADAIYISYPPPPPRDQFPGHAGPGVHNNITITTTAQS